MAWRGRCRTWSPNQWRSWNSQSWRGSNIEEVCCRCLWSCRITDGGRSLVWLALACSNESPMSEFSACRTETRLDTEKCWRVKIDVYHKEDAWQQTVSLTMTGYDVMECFRLHNADRYCSPSGTGKCIRYCRVWLWNGRMRVMVCKRRSAIEGYSNTDAMVCMYVCMYTLRIIRLHRGDVVSETKCCVRPAYATWI